MQHERGTRAATTNDRERQDSGGANYYTAPTHQTTTDQRQSMIQTAGSPAWQARSHLARPDSPYELVRPGTHHHFRAQHPGL
jgi:hypothetical protein